MGSTHLLSATQLCDRGPRTRVGRSSRLYLCHCHRAFLAQQKPNGTAFVIGEGGLLNALHINGYAVVDHSPDYVVADSIASLLASPALAGRLGLGPRGEEDTWIESPGWAAVEG